MYNITDQFINEVIQDFQEAKTDDEKNEIFDAFINHLWSVRNQRKVVVKHIKYDVPDSLTGDAANLFRQYNKIPYRYYKSRTNNMDSWHILRQKINSIYTFMCDSTVCTRDDYFELLHVPQNLFYAYRKRLDELNVTEAENKITQSLQDAEALLEKYGKQKMAISWNNYKMLINGWLRNILKNYIPYDQFEKQEDWSPQSKYWIEDNYAIRYIGRSINGYMKNYQKKYYGVRRNQKYERCECGNLYEKKSNSQKYCQKCSEQKALERHRKYNKKRITTNQKDRKTVVDN
jgi:hypothetical protein